MERHVVISLSGGMDSSTLLLRCLNEYDTVTTISFDYGHWQGAKKAVDEYFADSKVFVEKIDYTGVKIVKKC